MLVKKIELKNFRNYSEVSLNFDDSINIFYGDNAQGKTNILEAIYLSGTTKSHRGSKDKDIIKFNSDESHIRMEILKNNIPYKIDMHLRKSKSKAIAINGVPIKKAAELLGLLNIVFFSPEDLSIIKSGPSERRKFIDMELSQLDSYYLHNLSNYNKAVNQRNKILRDMYESKDLFSMLDVWDDQIYKYGSRIIDRRIKFFEELNEIIFDIHKYLTGEKEECRLVYDKNIEIDDYRDALISSRIKDIKYKQTSVGPHRDDFNFISSGIDIRKYGSQGQQRTAALSLKLSEIELIKKTVKDTPVLLLDDVLSELDSNRQKFLLEKIGNIQTLITCTGLDDFINDRFKIDRVFKVTNGNIDII